MCSFIMVLKRSGPNCVIVCLVSGVSLKNVSRISAQKRQDGSDGVQIGGRVHCGGERPGIWGALLPSPTSHHLPSSSPVHSALPDFVQLATSRAAWFSRRPLCSALGCAKFATAEQEELPLSRAETNSPPPPALTTVQSRVGL